jgi:hypothetical protein
MRFLIREQTTERLVAGGLFRYWRDGQPMGLTEQWRLTAAADGYSFLRLDLDPHSTAEGQSVLYQATIGPDGRVARLAFRAWRPGWQLAGSALWTGDGAILTRQINGQRREDEVSLADNPTFWLPTAAGLSLLASLSAGRPNAALTLEPERDFAWSTADINLEPAEPEPVMVMGRPVMTRPLISRQPNQQLALWLDEHNWPVQARMGNLLAVESRYVRFGEPLTDKTSA